MIFPLLFLLLGILCGRCVLSPENVSRADLAVTASLAVVVFAAGIGVGAKKAVFGKLHKHRAFVLLVPLGTVAGSVLSGVLLGVCLGMPLGDAMAISAGFGYYSLSAGLLAELGGASLGALAFTANMLRELAALAITPLVAKYCGHYAAIAPAGATSMDTVLGIISRATDEETTVLSMINGVILTALVPVLVPLLYRLF